jgi:hypothetical protein
LHQNLTSAHLFKKKTQPLCLYVFSPRFLDNFKLENFFTNSNGFRFNEFDDETQSSANHHQPLFTSTGGAMLPHQSTATAKIARVVCCQSCLAELTHFQISFDKALLLCTNKSVKISLQF